MKYLLIFELIQAAYAKLLRPLLVKSIDDPDTEWDDVVLRMVDRLFDFKA